MLAHGFTIGMMVDLVRAGLATATAERVVAGRRTIEVVRVRITDVGRRVLIGAVMGESVGERVPGLFPVSSHYCT
jgi:hypothetical protein